MSTGNDDLEDDEPTGLEDEPVDCYTNFYVIELPNPDDPNGPPVVFDGELISDHPLSERELEARVQANVGQFLGTLAASPRFRQRFGTQPQATVIGTGSIFGC